MNRPDNAAVLFSAYAEVFPVAKPEAMFVSAFLCLRRGVSEALGLISRQMIFSLPTQRCFYHRPEHRVAGYLFSAYAEVFLWGSAVEPSRTPFLCLRRGVSLYHDRFQGLHFFSLPTQRCFLDKACVGRHQILFSAYAEVFL